jgi:hypothetical protein
MWSTFCQLLLRNSLKKMILKNATAHALKGVSSCDFLKMVSGGLVIRCSLINKCNQQFLSTYRLGDYQGGENVFSPLIASKILSFAQRYDLGSCFRAFAREQLKCN